MTDASADRETVVRAVERQCPDAIPKHMCLWWGEGLHEQYGEELDALAAAYPDDVVMVSLPLPDWHRIPYSWRTSDAPEKRAHDAACLLPDWSHLDEFIEKSPKVEDLPGYDEAARRAERARSEGRYVLGHWWRFFFERPWGIRGMENLLIDYYDHPDEVHRLHAYLRDVYIAAIGRAAGTVRPDGIMSSDDLGNQRALTMSPGQFREFQKPYYRQVIAEARGRGMHFWLHSCGDNTEVMDDLIEVGVDVFHPVQKHCMDAEEIVRDFGDAISFWAGFDVQQTLRWGAPVDVREEVRRMVDTFDRRDGGLIMGSGNGITAGTPMENIVAFLDETHKLAVEHRRAFD